MCERERALVRDPNELGMYTYTHTPTHTSLVPAASETIPNGKVGEVVDGVMLHKLRKLCIRFFVLHA